MKVPKLPIPEHLLQDEKQAAADGRRLDALCEIAIPAIASVLPEIFQRRTVSDVAQSAFAEATRAIVQLLDEEKKRDDTSALPDAEALRSLRKHLGSRSRRSIPRSSPNARARSGAR